MLQGNMVPSVELGVNAIGVGDHDGEAQCTGRSWSVWGEVRERPCFRPPGCNAHNAPY